MASKPLAYEWLDHIVTDPDNFDFNGAIAKLLPEFGAILQQGTQLTAERMQEFIDTIDDCYFPRTAGVITYLSSIFSTGEGQAEEVQGLESPDMLGITLVNSVENGNFVNTTGWTGSGLSLSAANNILTGLSSGGSADAITSVDLKTTDTYYVYLEFKNNAVPSAVPRILGGGSQIIKQFDSTTDQQYASVIYTPNADYTSLYVRSYALSGETCEIKNVHVINMTALNKESYTEAEMLNFVRQGYIDGLQGNVNPSVGSDGVNKYSGIVDVADGFYLANGSFNVSPSWDVYSNKVIEGVSYTAQGDIFADITFWNGDLFISGVSSTTAVAPSGASEMRYNITKTNKLLANQQINEGVSALPYVPFEGSRRTAYTTLYDLPNLVRDRVYRDGDNVYRKDWRIEDYVLESADITTLTTSNVNNDYARITNSALIGLTTVTTQTNGQLNTDRTVGFDATTTSDLATNIWTHRQTATEIYVYVPKGYYANLAAAQADLAGTKIIYELATPTQPAIVVKGTYEAIEGGTTYNESETFNAELSFDYSVNPAAHRIKNTEGISELAQKIAPIQSYPETTVAGSIITLPDTLTQSRILFRIDEAVTGAPVQVSYDGVDYDLKEILPDGTLNDATYVQAGLKEVYWDGLNFILAPKGGALNEVDNQVALIHTTSLAGAGTLEEIAFTMPSGCKSFQFTDRVNWQTIGLPSSRLAPGNSTTAEWLLYDSSGSLIGTIHSATNSGNTDYLDNMFLSQDSDSIRCVYSINEQQFADARSQFSKSFTGQLSGATIRCRVTSLAVAVTSKLDGRVWTYR